MRCGLLLMIFLLAGCAASPAPTTPALSFVQLPEGAFPRFPFVAPDGAVWCSESSGEAIARIGADGAVSHVRIPGSSNSPAGIVQGPDGQIWFSGFELIGRISPSGELTGWRTGGQGPSIGLPDAITVGPNGAVWYTNDAESKSINSISPSGDIIRLPVPITDPDAQLSGITTGPDRALWFTVTSTVKSGAHFIGRMPIDGEKYQLWPVPGDASASGRIVAGPDGALWFTTTDGIGQMTVKGNFTDHPLPD